MQMNCKFFKFYAQTNSAKITEFCLDFSEEKKFVKTVLGVHVFISRNFCERLYRVHTVEFTYEIFVSRFFDKISVKTTSLVKSFTIKMISRKNSQMIQKFRKLHTVECSVVCKNEKTLNEFFFVKSTI